MRCSQALSKWELQHIPVIAMISNMMSFDFGTVLISLCDVFMPELQKQPDLNYQIRISNTASKHGLTRDSWKYPQLTCVNQSY